MKLKKLFLKIKYKILKIDKIEIYNFEIYKYKNMLKNKKKKNLKNLNKKVNKKINLFNYKKLI